MQILKILSENILEVQIQYEVQSIVICTRVVERTHNQKNRN